MFLVKQVSASQKKRIRSIWRTRHCQAPSSVLAKNLAEKAIEQKGYFVQSETQSSRSQSDGARVLVKMLETRSKMPLCLFRAFIKVNHINAPINETACL